MMTHLLGMGLSDLAVLFVFLFFLKLEIKIVMKIVGALILLEVAYLVYTGLVGGDFGQTETVLCLWRGCL